MKYSRFYIWIRFGRKTRLVLVIRIQQRLNSSIIRKVKILYREIYKNLRNIRVKGRSSNT